MDSPEAIARRFYDAMQSGDVSALNTVVNEDFADGAVLQRPESLPGGGVVTGREKIAAYLGRAAGKLPLVVNQIIVGESGSELFASVTITMPDREYEALEWWTLDGATVVAIRAFYWDTAAMLGTAAR